MERQSRQLTVVYSPPASFDLADIWEWNAKQYGKEHADRYVAVLKAGTEKLCRSRNVGQRVPHSDYLRYALLKRRRKGYGHLVVFAVEDNVFRVVRYFHTSQDWPSKVADESGSPD